MATNENSETKVDDLNVALLKAEEERKKKLHSVLRRQQCRGCYFCVFVFSAAMLLGFFVFRQTEIKWKDFTVSNDTSTDDSFSSQYEMHLRYNNPNYYTVTFKAFEITLLAESASASNFRNIGGSSVPEVTCEARSVCYITSVYDPDIGAEDEEEEEANVKNFKDLVLKKCWQSNVYGDNEDGAYMVATGSSTSTNGVSIWNAFVGNSFYWRCACKYGLPDGDDDADDVAECSDDDD